MVFGVAAGNQREQGWIEGISQILGEAGGKKLGHQPRRPPELPNPVAEIQVRNVVIEGIGTAEGAAGRQDAEEGAQAQHPKPFTSKGKSALRTGKTGRLHELKRV